MNGDNVIENWTELRALVEQIDVDMRKNANGNAAAGVRARKGLRNLKARAAELTKLTVEVEKSRKATAE
jgi:hypothetical protein